MIMKMWSGERFLTKNLKKKNYVQMLVTGQYDSMKYY